MPGLDENLNTLHILQRLPQEKKLHTTAVGFMIVLLEKNLSNLSNIMNYSYTGYNYV